MKILFIAYTTLDLYKPIESEMRRQGHDVTTVLYRANDIKHDPYKIGGRLRRMKKFLFIDIYNIHDSYWKKRISDTKELSDKYDFLFVLSGTSVGKFLINYIENQNPRIKKVLYTWDNLKYYDFRRLFPYFDKCYTFDIWDYKNNSEFSFLPIYYEEDKEAIKEESFKYDLFHIGSNHSGRYSFIQKLMPQILSYGFSYYIKVIGNGKVSLNLISKLHLLADRLKIKRLPEDEKESLEFVNSNDLYQIKAYNTISPDNYNCICRQSKVVIDTQRSNQSGLTARFMWALGNGKRIITTNRFAYEYAFVGRSQVQVVDFENPILPVDFIKQSNTQSKPNQDILQYRIDNWVKTVLS